MKKTIIYIISLLFMLAIPHGSIDAQTSMRIPLKQGYNNPSVRIGDMTIELINLFISSEPWDGRNLSLQLEMKITNPAEKYTTYLSYYETSMM